jgi:hypothetical protein
VCVVSFWHEEHRHSEVTPVPEHMAIRVLTVIPALEPYNTDLNVREIVENFRQLAWERWVPVVVGLGRAKHVR